MEMTSFAFFTYVSRIHWAEKSTYAMQQMISVLYSSHMHTVWKNRFISFHINFF